MATVYLAHDLRHNRKVAIKLLRPPPTDTTWFGVLDDLDRGPTCHGDLVQPGDRSVTDPLPVGRKGGYLSWPYHANYDVHPNGQAFAMIKQASEATARLVAVVNWVAEWQRAVAAEN